MRVPFRKSKSVGSSRKGSGGFLVKARAAWNQHAPFQFLHLHCTARHLQIPHVSPHLVEVFSNKVFHRPADDGV